MGLSCNVHAGHCPQGQGAYGATGILKESVEDRIVKDELIRLLRASGATVYDCTCEKNTTQDGCLQYIVKMCNKHKVTLDISIHLNSGRSDYKGDGSTGGVEVWNYDKRTKDVSDRICKNISNTLGIRNRGTKYSKDLYVLRKTNSLALLVECCFVDDKDDANKWDAKKCAKAIAEAVLGKTISTSTSSGSTSSTSKPSASKPTTNPSKDIDVAYQTYTANKWYPYVINYNTSNSNGYAGVLGYAIKGLRGYTKGDQSVAGNLVYRAHLKGSRSGSWCNWQTDQVKDKNGENFAGTLKKSIDGLQMYIKNAPGKSVRYRVHLRNGGWLPWVTNYGSGNNGYAGILGREIDAVQIDII